MPSVEASICEHKKSLVPVAAMLTVAEAMNHLKERQAVRTVSDRTIGEVCLTTTGLASIGFSGLMSSLLSKV